MATWSTALQTSLLTTYLVRKFVPTLEKMLQLQKFTTKAIIPEGEGKIARFNTFGNSSGNTSSLEEGTTTEGEITLTTTGYEATIAEYGEFVSETSLQKYVQVKGSREQLAKRMAYGAHLTIDLLIRAEALQASNTWYSTGAVSGGDTTTVTTLAMSAASVMGASELLWRNNVQGFDDVAGHPAGELACIVGTFSERDMVQEATTVRMTWAEANTNVGGAMGQEKWIKGKMGSVYGTACYRSQNLSQTSTGGVLADDNLLIGEGAIGCVGLEDMEPNIYINEASSHDIGNPYRNKNTIAWHINFATTEMDAARMVRLYAAGS